MILYSVQLLLSLSCTLAVGNCCENHDMGMDISCSYGRRKELKNQPLQVSLSFLALERLALQLQDNAIRKGLIFEGISFQLMSQLMLNFFHQICQHYQLE